jgi:hypothetical protein
LHAGLNLKILEMADPAVDESAAVPPTPPPVVESGAAPTEGGELTAEELAACVAVYRACLEAGLPANMLSPQLVIMATLTCKCRVDKTVEKLQSMHEKVFNVYEFDMSTDTVGFDATPSTIASVWGECDPFWSRYRVCGSDIDGRSVMWVAGGKTLKTEEKMLIHTSVLFFLAAHADLTTLRGGITFVIDTTKAPSEKVGNERKLQETWQAMPLRPQHFFIMGASWFKRLAINALLKIVSAFSNSKVVARIRFVDVDEVVEQLGLSSMPAEYGGDDRSATPTKDWVAQRLRDFPGAAQFAAVVADESAAAK